MLGIFPATARILDPEKQVGLIRAHFDSGQFKWIEKSATSRKGTSKSQWFPMLLKG